MAGDLHWNVAVQSIARGGGGLIIISGDTLVNYSEQN